ncbi:hypothetical protein HPG69_003492 [Diceros bicornis minor]|uniref:EF-hand domain-containing protein n=1 Tax=Diceros bicornis minor TaxID=77932 RepID=A0A7J7EA21_DICBM|nr:hypothetical protein HPG69_003492 [Diceros bicornis minor]
MCPISGNRHPTRRVGGGAAQACSGEKLGAVTADHLLSAAEPEPGFVRKSAWIVVTAVHPSASLPDSATLLNLVCPPSPPPRVCGCPPTCRACPSRRRPRPVPWRHSACSFQGQAELQPRSLLGSRPVTSLGWKVTEFPSLPCGPRSSLASAALATSLLPRWQLSTLQVSSCFVALMTLTLFPIRLLVAAFMMLLAWPFALLASLGSAEQEPEQPLALWRKVVDFLLRAIMRTMWFAGGFHRVVVKGRQALPTEAAILTVAPHSSYFDAIPVTMTMSSIVMKAESRDIPIWGTLIKYIKPVFVSRSDQDSRRKTVEEIKRRAQLNRKRAWQQSPFYSEAGMRCARWRTCCLGSKTAFVFPTGAFIPGVPVQPVVLRYPNKLDTITWTWQGPGALEILWLTLCQFHNQVEIEFLPVYSPSAEEKKDPALYASNVRRVMAEALGVPVTDYTYEDCQLALAEGQLRLPADTCLLEFARLVRGLGLKPEKLEKDLDKYAESAKMKRGEKIGLTEFAAFLEVPISDTLEDMFSLFDESGAGEMDLREYVVALSVVCRPSQTLDTIQLAFKASGGVTLTSGLQMYGSPEDGSIDEDTLSSILKTALGVAELAVTDLFRAIDQEEKEKITFADFNRLAEMHPGFAEEYLYPDQTCSESRAQPPPAPTPNGFCVDFSPENSDVGKKPVRKKLD